MTNPTHGEKSVHQLVALFPPRSDSRQKCSHAFYFIRLQVKLMKRLLSVRRKRANYFVHVLLKALSSHYFDGVQGKEVKSTATPVARINRYLQEIKYLEKRATTSRQIKKY